ncbi:MAG: hypothetical protein H6817_04540 [Phycisphaerales bacterium]|nr:hypothetical protein [Phycisphaerales bacterium]
MSLRTRYPRSIQTFWLCLLLACAFEVTACNQPAGPDDPDPDDPNPDYPAIELVEPAYTPTAWEKVAEGIEDDGSVSKETALKAFALAFGDIPGVTRPESDSNGVRCGSAAIRWVERYSDELSADELSAIEAALGGGDVDVARIIQGGASGEHSCTAAPTVSEDGPGAEQYRAVLEQELTKLEQVFGKSLGIPVYLTLGTNSPGAKTLAWTAPQTSGDCATSLATSCHIELLTDRPEYQTDTEVHSIISHELVHCFQFTWVPVAEALTKPEWLVEGFADFACEQLNPSAERSFFLTYTETPLRGLFLRTYDAQGFYFHLDTIGANTIGRFEEAFKAADSISAFTYLIEGLETELGDTWASSFALEPGRGDAWYMPEAPADAKEGVSMGTLVNGKSYVANPGEAGVRITHLDFDSDIVIFEVSGAKLGRVSWDGGGEDTLADVNGQSFCAIQGGCTCPEGTTGNPPQTQIQSISALVATSGTTETTTTEILGLSLEDYCHEEADPDDPSGGAVDSCIVGTWVSNEWLLPGPFSDLDGVGGNNAVVTISASGQAQWNFNNMQPITVSDDQIGVTTEMYSRGTASGRVATTGSTWTVSNTNLASLEGFAIDNILGQYALAGGPGLFVLLEDGTYSCSGSTLTYNTIDPVEGTTITVTLHKQ